MLKLLTFVFFVLLFYAAFMSCLNSRNDRSMSDPCERHHESEWATRIEANRQKVDCVFRGNVITGVIESFKRFKTVTRTDRSDVTWLCQVACRNLSLFLACWIFSVLSSKNSNFYRVFFGILLPFLNRSAGAGCFSHATQAAWLYSARDEYWTCISLVQVR